MDLTPTLEAKSDQLDAVDIPIGIRRVFTITKVTKGNADQPANLHLAEFPRPYRPGKNMRRVLSGCWGAETDKWPTNAQIELYTDPEVKFGGVAVGGLRISRLSHIDGQQKIPLILTKGKSVVWKVDPLPVNASSPPPVAEPTLVTTATLVDLSDLFARKRIAPDQQLAGVNKVTGGNAAALETITEAEALAVIAALQARPDVEVGS